MEEKIGEGRGGREGGTRGREGENRKKIGMVGEILVSEIERRGK